MSPVVAKIKSYVGLAASRVIPIRVPRVVEGVGCTGRMGEIAKELKISRVMIVTDEIIMSLGMVDSCIQSLRDNSIDFVLFDKVTPDPSANLAVEGCRIYLEKGCNGLIAFGGGSPMDCAKLIGVLSTNPLKDPKSFMGMLSISPFTTLPPLIAVPTTAGTGSEATIAAIITFPEEKKKYNLIDPKICPQVAVLDPSLLVKLPPSITAATGMDALTHAVESYVGVWRSNFTSEYSLKAVKGIFRHIRTCYKNGNDMNARQQLLKASFEAGVAFTRAGVGYVHAIAHQLGAMYHTPHGVANAMVLPYILDFYRPDCTDTFSQLAIAAELGSASENKEALADKFVKAVKDMRRDLEIPTFVKGLNLSSVNEIAQRALNEAHGNAFPFSEAPLKFLLETGYPVPKYMTLETCEEIVSQLVDPSQKTASKL